MRISISQIKLFKACRRAYELRYKENLVPIEKAEPLQVGSNYHELIERLNSGENLLEFEKDNSKELAMAFAYSKYILPYVNVKSAEEWFEYKLSEDDVLVGRVDGVADNGWIVEHKSVGSEITEQYEYNLLWDEQVLAYMLVYGVNKMYYTVCRKPTIRQKKNETDEEFFQRMIEWYDEDTESKIRLLEIERTDEEIQQFHKDLLAIVEEIKNTKNYYKCQNYCNVWGKRCEYSSICMNYDPSQTYIEFKEREEYTG